MSEIAEKKFQHAMLLGGLSVNLNHLKITKKYWPSRLILLHTDRQTPRQYPQKNQTDSSILSAFSEGSNLANNLKNHMSIHARIRTRTETRQANWPLTLWFSASSEGTFLLSLLCLTGFVAHLNGLLSTFCQFCQYQCLSRMPLDGIKQWWHDSTKFGLTRAIQMTSIEVTKIGSLLCKLVIQLL